MFRSKESARIGGIKNVKTILAVASGKGGVGKSTLAVNLSIALAQMNANEKPEKIEKTEKLKTEKLKQKLKPEKLKIGLLDADLYGPSLVQMLALNKPPQRNSDGLVMPEKRFGVSTLSMGAMIKDGQALVWRGPLIGRALKQLLEGSDWGELDILILDLPPGTGDLPLTLAQSASIDAALLVSTPQQVALYDVRKSSNMFEKLRIPVIGIIENMSGFQCPHCGGKSYIFASGGAQLEAEKTKVPFLGKLPISQALQESGDNAMPIMAQGASDENNDGNGGESSGGVAQRNSDGMAQRNSDGNSRNNGENAESKAQKAHYLHTKELRESIRAIATLLLEQLEKLQKKQQNTQENMVE